MDKIRIIIADDHCLFKTGIKAILEEDDSFEVVGEAENGNELLSIISYVPADVILADIMMPEMTGLDAIPKIKEINPSLKIIMLTMHEDGEYIIQSMKKGAHGYLLKTTDEYEFRRAIKTVANDKVYFSNKVSKLMIQNLSAEYKKTSLKKLTNREIEVLKLISQGMTNKSIASNLFISVRTVETHRQNMVKKMAVKNTTELVKKAIEAGVIK